MRFVTMIAVLALLVCAGIAYANGSSTTTTTPPEVTTPPSGTGPTTTTPPPEATQPTTPPCETTPAPPPTGTGPCVSGCGVIPNPPTSAITTSPEVEAYNTNLVVSTYCADPACVTALRQAGWTWGDIYLMAQISSKTKQPITTVATWRSQGMSWSDIACRNNLTAMDLTTPTVVTTKVAGYTGEIAPQPYQPIYYLADHWGNPVLTRFDAQRLERLGYRWQDIAVAANISAVTGENITTVLGWTNRGYTWTQISQFYGLDASRVMNISLYPYAPPGTPVGAGPCGKNVCPVAQPTHCQSCGAPVPPCGAGPAPTHCQSCGAPVPPCGAGPAQPTHCPSCGAPVPPCGAGPAPTHCKSCGAPVAPPPCGAGPTCPPAQPAHCPSCGATVTAPPCGAGPCATPPPATTCPSCGAIMTAPPTGAGPSNPAAVNTPNQGGMVAPNY